MQNWGWSLHPQAKQKQLSKINVAWFPLGVFSLHMWNLWKGWWKGWVSLTKQCAVSHTDLKTTTEKTAYPRISSAGQSSYLDSHEILYNSRILLATANTNHAKVSWWCRLFFGDVSGEEGEILIQPVTRYCDKSADLISHSSNPFNCLWKAAWMFTATTLSWLHQTRSHEQQWRADQDDSSFTLLTESEDWALKGFQNGLTGSPWSVRYPLASHTSPPDSFHVAGSEIWFGSDDACSVCPLCTETPQFQCSARPRTGVSSVPRPDAFQPLPRVSFHRRHRSCIYTLC